MVNRGDIGLGVETQELLSEGRMFMKSDTEPTPCPSASSKDAMNSVPAAKGRNVTAAPVLVVAFQEGFGIVMEMGVVLKGMTVKVRGSAAGGLPPAKDMLNGPHCCISENLMVLKANTELDDQARGPKNSKKKKSTGMANKR